MATNEQQFTGLAALVAQVGNLQDRLDRQEKDLNLRFPKPFRVRAANGGTTFEFSRDDTGLFVPTGI